MLVAPPASTGSAAEENVRAGCLRKRGRRGRPLGRLGRCGHLPELQKVVGGGDHAPFGACGGSAAALESVDLAIEFRLSEDGLDHRLSAPVKTAAVVVGEHSSHVRVDAALPAGPRRFSPARVRRDQDLDAAIDDRLHLLVMPVAGVGQHDTRCVFDARASELALGGVDHRLEVPEVAARDHHLSGQDDLMLVGDGLRVVALDEPAQPLDDV